MGTSYIHKYPGIPAPQPGAPDWVPCVVERVEWNEAEGGYEIFVRTQHELKRIAAAVNGGVPRRRTIAGTGPRPTGYTMPDSMHNVADWSREDQAKWAQARKEEQVGITQEAGG